jgi:hypothetical protein
VSTFKEFAHLFKFRGAHSCRNLGQQHTAGCAGGWKQQKARRASPLILFRVFSGKKSGKAIRFDSACARELWFGPHGCVSESGQNECNIVRHCSRRVPHQFDQSL